MLSWDSGVHTLSFLWGSDLERTEALWSSGASLILEMNCQFIFAEPGSESHSCVYGTAPDSLLPIGNRQTPEAVLDTLAPPFHPSLSIRSHTPARHSGCPAPPQSCQAWVLVNSSFWNVLSLLLLWGNSHSTVKTQFKSDLLCGVF